MKKIFFALLLFSFSMANAQQSMTASKDTNRGADTSYVKVKLTGFNEVASFQLIATKDTGTVAGYAVLQASLEDGNYVDISTDTLTLQNKAVNTKLWTLTNSPYTYYQIAVRTSGGSLLPRGNYVARNPPKPKQ